MTMPRFTLPLQSRSFARLAMGGREPDGIASVFGMAVRLPLE
jgi:hypothetical protein